MLVKNMKMGTNIPCEICANHFREYTAKKPIEDHIKTKESAFKYFFDLHNDVNVRNKKKIFLHKIATRIYNSSSTQIKEDFEIDILKLIENNKIHTIPTLMNGTVRNILKKKYNLL